MGVARFMTQRRGNLQFGPESNDSKFILSVNVYRNAAIIFVHVIMVDCERRQSVKTAFLFLKHFQKWKLKELDRW